MPLRGLLDDFPASISCPSRLRLGLWGYLTQDSKLFCSFLLLCYIQLILFLSKPNSLEFSLLARSLTSLDISIYPCVLLLHSSLEKVLDLSFFLLLEGNPWVNLGLQNWYIVVPIVDRFRCPNLISHTWIYLG
jgi:hypothetical protein